MAHVSCNLLPNFVVEQFIYPPYEEAKNQLSYAFFQSKVGEEALADEGLSLIGRAVHLIEGLILMIPVVNWVVYVAMQYLNLTITGQFQNAVESGDRDMVEFYLNLEFNPDSVNDEGKPFIIVAAEAERFEIVQQFLTHGASANAAFERTPLIHTLIEKGEYELAKDAIRQYEADSALLDAQGRTILQKLYDNDYEEFLPFINEGIVHPNLMNAQGDTILHHILKSIPGGQSEDHGQVIGGIIALAEKDVDLNIRSGSTRQTPLWMAYQKLGGDAVIALMNYGALPNEQGDLGELYPGASNIFGAAWEGQWQTKLFVAALKHGARMPVADFANEFRVCNTIRQLDKGVLEELYNTQDAEQARLTLLKAMDDAGWGTFTKAYQMRDTWGVDTWLRLLERGVRPPSQISKDAIMGEVLSHGGLQGEEERRNRLLLGMQQSGWEMVRVANQRGMDETTFMLLRHGARPPANAMNQTELIKKVITSPHKKEIIPIMIENGWNFQAYCDEAVRTNDYDGVRFAIEMGMEVPNLNWHTACNIADFRTKVVLPGIDGVIPQGLGMHSEDRFIGQLLVNIQQYNEAPLNLQKINPLEVMLFIHSQEGIKRVMREVSFEQFSKMLTHVVTKYPRINVDWFWSELLEIPNSHYANFATVQGGADELPDLPYRVPIDTLLTFFDRINFTDPDRPYYKDENARMDQNHRYSSASLRDGVGSIIRRINHNLPDAVAPNDPNERARYYADHRRHLEAVAYYMQLKWDDQGRPIPDPDRPGEFLREDPHAAEPLDGVKANVLIDLGRTGKMCSGRWKDIMYQCRCRLSGEGEKNLSFVDQMRTLWGAYRYTLLNHILGRYPCTHTHDNLLYHLKETRGIPGDKPVRLDNYGNYRSLHDQARAIQDFDNQGYHPRDVMELMIDHMRQNNDEGNAFRELMLPWMSDNLAQVANLSCPTAHNLNHLRANARVRGYQDQRLPYATIEAFMQDYNGEYHPITHSVPNIEALLSRMRNDPLLTPFWTRIELPQPDALQSVLDQPVKDAQEAYDAFMRLCLSPEQQEKFDQSILNKAQAERPFAEVEQQLLTTLNEHSQDQRDYMDLKGKFKRTEEHNKRAEEDNVRDDIRTKEEQLRFDEIIQRHAPTYVEKHTVLQEAMKEYSAFCMQVRTKLQRLNSPQKIMEFFLPDTDINEFLRLQEAVRETREAFEKGNFDDGIRAILKDGDLERFNKLVQDDEWGIIEDQDEIELTQIRERSPEYQRLKKASEDAEEAFDGFMQPFYQKTGAKKPPRQNGVRFFLDEISPLHQRVENLKGGAMGSGEMQQAFIENADSIEIKRDQTLGQFMNSHDFLRLRDQLGEEFILQSGIDAPELRGKNLSDPAVKRALAAFFANVALLVSAQPFSRYLSDFQKEAFIPHMRPLKIVDVDGRQQQRNVFERTKGFNPLVMYQMLVELGELRYKDRGIFQGAFEALPPQVDVVA